MDGQTVDWTEDGPTEDGGTEDGQTEDGPTPELALASMASVAHLVRHGEVENPRHTVYADLPGFNLSARGRRQARWAGDTLASHPIRAVYASPLDRAVQTASEIAVRHDLACTVVPDLTEWELMSRWRGLRWPELDRYRPGELDAYLTDPLQMDFSPESVEELAARVGGTVAALTERRRDQEIVVVCHQDPIQAARLVLTGRPLALLHEAKPRHCELISLVPGTPWTEIARRVPVV